MNAKRPKMHEHIFNAITGFFNGDAFKGAVISGIGAVAVWSGHTLITKHDETRDQATVLAAHTQQIAALQATTNSTQDKVNTIIISQTRMEGVVNTINQKLDDDRRQQKMENIAHNGRN